MVKLLEYQGKELFLKYGINVPKSTLLKDKTDIPEIKAPSFLKAQVPVGHRGERGGIVKVTNKAEAEKAMKDISKIKFDGYAADVFLLEEEIPHTGEFYVSISLDRSAKLPVLLISNKGGIDIEKIEDTEIHRYIINPFIGIPDYFSRRISRQLSIPDISQKSLSRILNAVFDVYKNEDAELVEINPLILNPKIRIRSPQKVISADEKLEETVPPESMQNDFMALDSKVVIEDDAMFRHMEITDHTLKWLDPLEMEAKKKGISFVRLGGDIGLIANGAGLTMATLDIIKANGGSPGDFLDLGGTDDPNKVVEAFNLVEKTDPKALLINIFGGVTKCDSVAQGLLEAIDKTKPAFPITVRLRGFNEKEAVELLAKRGITALSGLEDAIRQTIFSSKEKAK